MNTRKLRMQNLTLSALIMLGAWSDINASNDDRCNVGNALSALEAFYPGLVAVNEVTFETGQFEWVVVRPGGVGAGLANCNFRLFAASVPFLPDAYEFCAGDVFIGGNAWSFPYTDQDSQAYLDYFYPDIKGYRNKAIADLSLVEEQVTITRTTYLDEYGNEWPVGDGGSEDPALTDPTAGDPKPQVLLETAYKNFKDFSGTRLVYRHEAFLAQLEAGTYWVDTVQFFDGIPFPPLTPVELNIVPCD